MERTHRSIEKNLKGLVRSAVKALFSPLGFDLVRRNHDGGLHGDYKQFIPFQPTISAAKQSGLSLGDYIDAAYNVSGATQETIDSLKDFGVFNSSTEHVCEIGPGTGRYLEKVIAITNPVHCEIYETAKDWESYLVQKYDVVAQPSDGASLCHTPSNSIDLVMAHKVFPGQPSLVICRYFEEMARVLRLNGKAVFDIVTEDCLDDTTLHRWLDCGISFQSYPCLFPKRFAVDFFTKSGFSFDGSFIVSMNPGKTEAFVFTKRCAA
jgi:hypothetical protein